MDSLLPERSEWNCYTNRSRIKHVSSEVQYIWFSNKISVANTFETEWRISYPSVRPSNQAITIVILRQMTQVDLKFIVANKYLLDYWYLFKPHANCTHWIQLQRWEISEFGFWMLQPKYKMISIKQCTSAKQIDSIKSTLKLKGGFITGFRF